MEIGFIAQATRRYWWLVVAFFALGLTGGVIASPSPSATYTSIGLIDLSSPSGAQGALADRYIAEQIIILESTELSQSVAEDPAVDVGLTALAEAVRFEQVDETDFLEVRATTERPQLSQAMAMAYLNRFVDVSSETVKEEQLPRRAATERALERVEAELALVGDQVDAALDELVVSTDGDAPSIDELDPTLATVQSSLIEEYGELLRAQSDLNLELDSQVARQIIQLPAVPTSADPVGRSSLLFVGPIFGLLLGVTAAAIAARLSRRVLGTEEAEEIIGLPFVGQLDRMSALDAPFEEVLESSAGITSPVIELLCVRAESNMVPSVPFVLLVTGTQRAAGISSIAAAIASNFAGKGKNVTLIDADVDHPDLTSGLAQEPLDPPPASATSKSAMAMAPASASASASASANQLLINKNVNDLRFIGFNTKSRCNAQPADVLNLTEGVAATADVVVVDGGPLMASASTLQLSRRADALVLAVPVPRQAAESLRTISRQLDLASGEVFPVATPRLPSRRSQATIDFDEKPDQHVTAG